MQALLAAAALAYMWVLCKDAAYIRVTGASYFLNPDMAAGLVP